MIETAINLLGHFSLAYLSTGESPSRFGNVQTTAAPVGTFETMDGQIYLACANDRTFQRLATEVLGMPKLVSDPRFAGSAARRENRQPLMDKIAEVFRDQPRTQLLARMHEAGVPAGAVRSVGEALNGPEIAHLGLLSEIPHRSLGTVPNVGLPIHMSGTPLADPVGAPPLGADTDQVLRDLLGLSDSQLAELAAQGALGAARRALNSGSQSGS